MALPKKKIKVPERKAQMYTPCEKSGLDPVTFANNIIDAGKRRAILNEIAEQAGCLAYEIPEQDKLTIPMLKEIQECLRKQLEENQPTKKLKRLNR